MASVTLKDVRKVYDGDVEVIKGANVEIKDKEFVVLVGPSGCGKSTLLRMIAGLEDITEGEVCIGDTVVNDVPPKDRDIAMVFQNYALYPHMTVFDNMAFGLKLRKFSPEEIKKRVHEAAEILGISEYLDRRPKALSGGQRQRVAIGRAIVRKPKVFLFDEPLSNLDAKLRVQMRVEISRLHNKLQATMIYVTHDQIEAMTMGNRIVVLKDGIVQQMDSPMNLYKEPANKFVAGFIGSPAMNFIPGKLVRNGSLSFQTEGINFKVPETLEESLGKNNGEVMLGVRPENIYDLRDDHKRNLSDPQRISIDVVEPIGNEVFLYFKNGEENLCIRSTSENQYSVNEQVEVAFDLDKIYFFDQASSRRIA